MVNILVTGGSGYLGQFLVAHLSKTHTVAYTYHNNPLPDGTLDATAYQVDCVTGAGLQEAFTALNPVHAVVNCAAIAQPAVCEQDYPKTCAVNVPTTLVQALQLQKQTAEVEALLVHISTDQVSPTMHLAALGYNISPCHVQFRLRRAFRTQSLRAGQICLFSPGMDESQQGHDPIIQPTATVLVHAFVHVSLQVPLSRAASPLLSVTGL